MAKDVGQLGPVPVPSARNALVRVIEIGSRHEMTEHHLRYVHLLLPVDLDGYALPVVVDADERGSTVGALGTARIDGHVHTGAGLVSQSVVRCIDQYFVEHFVQGWNQAAIPLNHAYAGQVVLRRLLGCAG